MKRAYHSDDVWQVIDQCLERTETWKKKVGNLHELKKWGAGLLGDRLTVCNTRWNFFEHYKIDDKDTFTKKDIGNAPQRSPDHLKLKSGMQLSMYNTTFEDIKHINDKQSNALRIIKEFVQFSKSFLNSGVLITIYGGTGTGKTMMCHALLNNLIRFTGKVYAYICYNELLIKLHAGRNNNISEMEIKSEYLAKPLLIIDEIGYDDTDYAIKTLLHIINTRLGRNMPTIVVSNKSADQLRIMFGAKYLSLYSRMFGSDAITLPCFWGDYRVSLRK